MPARGPGWSGTPSGTTVPGNPGNRAGKISEPGWIAVRVQDQPGRALRGETGDHPVEERAPGKPPQRLVAPAHAPGQAAGEDEAEHRRHRNYSMTMRGAARGAGPPVRFAQSLAAMPR